MILGSTEKLIWGCAVTGGLCKPLHRKGAEAFIEGKGRQVGGLPEIKSLCLFTGLERSKSVFLLGSAILAGKKEPPSGLPAPI